MTVLFVVATIIFFLCTDWLVRRLRGETAARALPAASRAEQERPLRVPRGVFFARSHTWLNLWPSGKVRIGIDDFVARLMDHPRLRFLKSAGHKVEKGEPILTVEEAGQALTVRSPVSGTIVNVNAALEEDAAPLRDALFSEGWAYTILPSKPGEIRALLLGDETRDWMSLELGRFRDLLAAVTPQPELALQDGGTPVPGALRFLGPEGLKRFERMFLETDN